jgi:hypothetical protein
VTVRSPAVTDLDGARRPGVLRTDGLARAPRGADRAAPGGARRATVSAARTGLAVLGLATLATGCAAGGNYRLDPSPGHRIVVGSVDLGRFNQRDAHLDIVRLDGTYRHALLVNGAQRDFAITLPPGRYAIARLRLAEGLRSTLDRGPFDLRVIFDVGEAPTIYVGALSIAPLFGQKVRVEVRDDYERTIAALRARRLELPEPIVRALMRPV